MLDPGDSPIEMGYTIREFSRVLNGNFSATQSPYSCKTLGADSWLISHDSSAFNLQINVEQKPTRQIGLLGLPVLGVRFNLISGNEQEKQQFFEKFFRYFHKGGG
jgi:hypothetical protein